MCNNPHSDVAFAEQDEAATLRAEEWTRKQPPMIDSLDERDAEDEPIDYGEHGFPGDTARPFGDRERFYSP